MPFIFFFVAWARTSSSIPNKSGVGKSKHSSFVPNSGKAFNCHHYDFSCGFFIDAIYLIEEVPAYYTSLLRGFVFWFLKSWLSVRFYQMFFSVLTEMKVCFFIHYLINMIYYRSWFSDDKSILHLWNEFHLSQFFICCQICFANILLKIIMFMFMKDICQYLFVCFFLCCLGLALV